MLRQAAALLALAAWCGGAVVAVADGDGSVPSSVAAPPTAAAAAALPPITRDPHTSPRASCDDEDETRNLNLDVARLKAAVVASRWVEALDTARLAGDGARFDFAMCVDGVPLSTFVLTSYLDTPGPFEPAARALLLFALEHGVDPNTDVGTATASASWSSSLPSSPDTAAGVVPTPLARVLATTPHDVALVRSLLIAGHALTEPRLGPTAPTYLHLLPVAHRAVLRSTAARVAQALYLARYGTAASLEDAFRTLAAAHNDAAQQCAMGGAGGGGGTEGTQSAADKGGGDQNRRSVCGGDGGRKSGGGGAAAVAGSNADPRVVLDGLFEASLQFQDLDFGLLAAAKSGRPADPYVSAKHVEGVATETARTLLFLLLNSPAASRMLAADQIALADPTTGWNMLHAVTALGDEEVLGMFTDAVASAMQQQEPATGDDVPTSQMEALREALTGKDRMLGRTSMHYAATMDGKLVSITRSLLALATGGANGTPSVLVEAIAAEQAAFPEVYNATDVLGETPGSYMKLYNTEAAAGDVIPEDMEPIKTQRELVEKDAERLIPSESEMVNRVILKKRTMWARKDLAKQEERLAAIHRGDPVSRVLDSHDDLMRVIDGPSTFAQLKARQNERDRAYIDYADREMVAQELAAQEERVAAAQDKLEGYLEQALLEELAKPAHMMDHNLAGKPKVAGPFGKKEEVPKQTVRGRDINGCDINAVPFEEFDTTEGILMHIALSEGPVVFRGPAPGAADAGTSGGAVEGWAFRAFADAAAATTAGGSNAAENGQCADDMSTVAEDLRNQLLQHLGRQTDASVHTQPAAIEELPKALLRDGDAVGSEAFESNFSATFLDDDDLGWITDGTTCHVSITEDAAQQCGVLDGRVGERPLPGTLSGHSAIDASPSASAAVQRLAAGAVAKSLFGEDPATMTSRVYASSIAHFGGPGSGRAVAPAEEYELVFQLEGTQNWAVLPPDEAVYAVDSTMPFFKDTFPPLYTTSIHMCALKPGDVLFLPPRYGRGSVRGTASVDVTLRLPGLVVPFVKTRAGNE